MRAKGARAELRVLQARLGTADEHAGDMDLVVELTHRIANLDTQQHLFSEFLLRRKAGPSP